MAKTLNEQASLPGAATSLVTAGAPMHALYARDMGRWINNLGTYVEPSFQFAMDASDIGVGSGQGQQLGRIWRDGDPGTGTIFVAQRPLLVNPQAKYLCWTAGFTRGLYPNPEAAVPIDVVGMTVYLSNAPYRHDRPAAAFTPLATGPGDFPTFSSGYLQPGFTQRSIVSGDIQNGTAGGSSGLEYGFVDDTDPGWDSWLPAVIEQHQESIAWLIVTISFENASEGSGIFLKEFSSWHVYE